METKRCPGCKETKPYQEFYSNRARPDGLSVRCRKCVLEWYTNTERDRRAAARKVLSQTKPLPLLRGTFALDGRKVCPRCGENKEATAQFFSRNRSEPDGFDRYCRLCKRAKWKQTKDTFILQHREKSIRPDTQAVRDWRYRIKLEMVEAYGGKCECCSEDGPEFLTLDHIGGKNEQNHPWSPKRGGHSIYGKLKKMGWPKDHYRLLCMNCNWASRMTGVCPHQLKKQ